MYSNGKLKAKFCGETPDGKKPSEQLGEPVQGKTAEFHTTRLAKEHNLCFYYVACNAF